MNGRFVIGDLVTVAATREQKTLDVILPPGLSRLYTVEKKDLPSGLPATWRDPDGSGTYSLVWLNNYCLKEKSGGGKSVKSVSEDYELQFEIIQQAGWKQTRPFYYDGEKVVPFPAGDYAEIEGNKYSARLRLSDPPVAIGGK